MFNFDTQIRPLAEALVAASKARIAQPESPDAGAAEQAAAAEYKAALEALSPADLLKCSQAQLEWAKGVH